MSDSSGQLDWPTVIGPAVYDGSVFRLLQLPVNASEREVHRRLQAVQMALQLEAPIPPGPARVLPITVTSESLAHIPLRLQNPGFRLLQELFWFWPGQNGQPSGEGWNCLQAGDQVGAAAAWTHGVFSRDMDPSCIHNLAVLRHWQALEGERRLMAGQAVEGSRQSLWRAALRHWRDWVTHEGLAAYLATRLAAIADPRLSHHTIDDLKRGLPPALGAVNAALAAIAAERGDTPSVEMHLTLLREAGLGAESVQMLFQRDCPQVSSVIKALCDSAGEGDDPTEAAHQLLARAEAPLIFLSAAYPDGHAEREDAANAVGMTVYSLMTATEPPWAECAALLERSLALVTGQTRQAAVKKELAAARGHEHVAMITDLTHKILGTPQTLATKHERLKREVEPLLARIGTVLGKEHWSYESAAAVVAKALNVLASRPEPTDRNTRIPSEQMIPVYALDRVDVHRTTLHHKQENACSEVAKAVQAAFADVAAEAFPVVVLMGAAAPCRFSLASAVGRYLRTMHFEGDIAGGDDDLVVESNVTAKMAEVFRVATRRRQAPYLIVIGESGGHKGQITITRGPDSSGFTSPERMIEGGSVNIVGAVSQANSVQAAEACDEILAMATVIAKGLLEFHRDYAGE